MLLLIMGIGFVLSGVIGLIVMIAAGHSAALEAMDAGPMLSGTGKLFFLLPAAFIAIGAFLLRIAWKARKPKRQNALPESQKKARIRVIGEFRSAEYHDTLGGYYVAAVCAKDADGNEQIYYSKPLGDDPTGQLKGKQIPVYIDPENPEQYTVDLFDEQVVCDEVKPTETDYGTVGVNTHPELRTKGVIKPLGWGFTMLFFLPFGLFFTGIGLTVFIRGLIAHDSFGIPFGLFFTLFGLIFLAIGGIPAAVSIRDSSQLRKNGIQLMAQSYSFYTLERTDEEGDKFSVTQMMVIFSNQDGRQYRFDWENPDNALKKSGKKVLIPVYVDPQNPDHYYVDCANRIDLPE